MTEHALDPDTTTSAAGDRYRIDPAATTITFTTRHLFGLAEVAGTMAVADGHVDATSRIGVTVRIDAASFATGSAKRDADVRGPKFLDAAGHPDLVFAAADVPREGGDVAGSLTVRGSTTPVTVHVDRVEVSGDRLTVHGRVRIDRFAVGLTAARGMAARRLDVRLVVVAHRSA